MVKIQLDWTSLDSLKTEALSCSLHTLNQARDYVYQDRVGPMLLDPEEKRLAGRIRGYQDDYVPHFQETAQGITVDCSCAQSRICAHATALLLARQREPWRVLELSRVRIDFDSRWPWMTEEAFNWQRVAYPDPVFLQPCDNELHLPTRWPWSNPSVSGRHEDLLNQLAVVNPSWWQSPAFSTAFHELWSEGAFMAVALRHFDAWLDLAWRGPEVPLTSLWQNARGLLSESTMTIERMLWRTSANAEDPALCRLRVLKCLELLEMAWGKERMTWLEALRQQFDWADPDGLEMALFYRRMGFNEQAAATLETHLPDDRSRRRAYRTLLIEWTEGETRFGHRVADLLENPSEERRQEILGGLTVEEQDRLRQTFPALDAKISGPGSPAE